MQTKGSLVTANDITDVFEGFKNDKERIKYMSEAYKNISLSKAFGIFYGVEISPEIKQNKAINSVVNINIGGTYIGTVKEFSHNTLTFTITGVKEELIAKDNFNTCMDEVNNYLLTHNNQLMFEVREKKDGKYYVSVIDAYYKIWKQHIDRAIQNEEGIDIHIDSLVNGGYVCHTPIWTINELTGKNYTSSVFVPGSHIVLNIEYDFEKWINQDITIVPQKFVEYVDYKTGERYNSLVGSRKRVLQIQGMVNMFNIYNRAQLANKDGVIATPEKFKGVVTGIINSNKNTGVFIELTDEHITGLAPIESSDLLNYKPGNEVTVSISLFEVQEGKEPFILNKKGNKIVKCNVRPVFKIED